MFMAKKMRFWLKNYKIMVRIFANIYIVEVKSNSNIRGRVTGILNL